MSPIPLYGIIDKATGDLLRAGFTAFDQQPEFDSANEEARNDLPYPPRIVGNDYDNIFHRWNGSAWEEVAQ